MAKGGDLTEVTYYTVANAPFFPGAVALLNSLRLTGNEGELVFLDTGLSDEQRARLEPHSRLERAPAVAVAHPTLLKPFVHELHRGGVAVLVDSDIIVTRSLAPLVEQAATGKLCAYRDHPEQLERVFEAWSELFELRKPIRPRLYVNAGLVALGEPLADWLLRRWWEATERLHDQPLASDAAHPVWDLDQDALNALLMSEVEPGDVVDLPDEMAIPPAIYRARVVAPDGLAVALDGHAVRVLHYTAAPKPWDRFGWTRVRRDAYTELLPRLLFGNDVLVRLEHDEVPIWLRGTGTGERALSALNLVNRAARGVATHTPRAVEERLRRLRLRLARP